MKKLASVVVALLAFLAIGSIAVAGEKTKVKAKVTASFSSAGGGGGSPGFPPYQPPTPPAPVIAGFNGKVKVKVQVRGTKVSKKKAKKICKKGRKITISNGIGETKTNKQGEFLILRDSRPPAGTYEVKAQKKKKPGKKLTCKSGKTQVTVP